MLFTVSRSETCELFFCKGFFIPVERADRNVVLISDRSAQLQASGIIQTGLARMVEAIRKEQA